MYVRVSVHNVTLFYGGNNKGTVAVGDTFLFAAHSTTSKIDLTHSLDQSNGSKITPPPVTLLGDAVCVTHPLPYYRCFLGGDLEERACSRLLNCTRSANMYDFHSRLSSCFLTVVYCCAGWVCWDLASRSNTRAAVAV